MKTWLTYLAAVALALAATLLMGQSETFCVFVTDITLFIEQVGMVLMFLLVAFSFTSGIASLRKDGKLKGTVWTSILWALASTVVVSLIGALMFLILPSKFPVTSTTGGNSSFLSSYPFGSMSFQSIASSPFTLAGSALLPFMMIVFFFLGYFLKPNVEVIRPAYVTTNSFSELMFRLGRACTICSYAFVFFAGCSFFSTLMREGSIFVAGRFLTMLVIACLVALLGILPLLFAIFTNFKINPYVVLYRSVASLAMGLFSGNIALSLLVNEPTTRYNLGCQKRISATTAPFHASFSHGGSAMIATLCCLSMLYAVDASKVTASLIFVVTLACALVSFSSSLNLGYEVFFITVLTFRMLGINMYGVEISILALLPMLAGMGIMVDNLIANMGAVYTAEVLGNRIEAPYKDTL